MKWRRHYVFGPAGIYRLFLFLVLHDLNFCFESDDECL